MSKPDLVYGIEDRPPAPAALFAAIQHLLAIFVGIITPPLLIAGGLHVEDPKIKGFLISMSLFASGVCTFIQCRRVGPVGAKLLCVQGTSFQFIGPLIAKGGLNGVKFELVALDDKHDATMVSSVYAELVKKGMQVSLGTVTSAPCLEFKNLAKEDNVFFLTPSASNDLVPEFANGYQMCFADGNQGAAAAKFVNENYAGKTIGVFYKADDSYSKGIFDQFKGALVNVETIDTSFTDATSTDFASQINQVKDCDFIFMPIYYTPASIFMTQAKGIIADNAIYYGCDGLDGIDSMDGFDVTSVPQEVSMLSHFNSKATDGAAKVFIDKYVATYGQETMNMFAASAYDSVYAIYEALKAANVEDVANASASDICEALKAQFNGGFTFSGVTGENIKWNANGFVDKVAVKYVVKAAD